MVKFFISSTTIVFMIGKFLGLPFKSPLKSISTVGLEYLGVSETFEFSQVFFEHFMLEHLHEGLKWMG